MYDIQVVMSGIKSTPKSAIHPTGDSVGAHVAMWYESCMHIFRMHEFAGTVDAVKLAVKISLPESMLRTQLHAHPCHRECA